MICDKCGGRMRTQMLALGDWWHVCVACGTVVSIDKEPVPLRHEVKPEHVKPNIFFKNSGVCIRCGRTAMKGDLCNVCRRAEPGDCGICERKGVRMATPKTCARCYNRIKRGRDPVTNIPRDHILEVTVTRARVAPKESTKHETNKRGDFGGGIAFGKGPEGGLNPRTRAGNLLRASTARVSGLSPVRVENDVRASGELQAAGDGSCPPLSGPAPETLRLVTQPTPFSCLACCAAMVTGEDLATVFEALGHDGSASHFRFVDVAGFLNCYGLHLGASRFERLQRGFEDPALLIVQGSGGGNHAVLWTGHIVLDPGSETVEKELTDYTILEWWDITRFTD